jgi:hypothetical protein
LSDAGIPQHVAEFLDQHVNSIVQVEVLLLLQRSPDVSFTAATVGKELRIDAAWAAAELAYLAGHGLLVSTNDPGEPSFRYQPATDALRAAVEGLSRAYTQRRVSVITRIFSKPSDKIRTFADAFRIRKDT